MSYLKYYVNNNQAVDSIACKENQEPIIPQDFTEWFNPNEWHFVPSKSEEFYNMMWFGHLERKR